MINQNTNEDRIKSEILSIVNDRWKESETAILLSELGLELKKRGADYQNSKINQKFSHYVSSIDGITLVNNPNSSNIIGAIPSGSNYSIDTIFKRPDRIPRIHPSAWAAFIKSIDEGKIRYISLLGQPKFRDLDTATKPDAGWHEIENDYIVSPEPSGSSHEKVYESILRWCEAHGVEVSMLHDTRTSIKDNKFDGSPMDIIFERLSDQDLSKISMTLDVVKKLTRK